jgi:hypothetical protein
MAIRDDMEDVQEAVINELITENGITNTLADGQVTETKIANGAVTAAKLGSDVDLTVADGSITPAKLDRDYLESTGGSVSGNLLMGTTNYDVSFSSTDTGISMQPAAQVHLSSNGTALILNHPNNITGTIQQIRYNGSIVGTISNTSSSTSYNTSSDYRLKENVVDLTGATERLKQLEPKRFNFIADADTTVDGFLAHEVQDIVPEAITGTKDEVDADGNPEYQGIDQSKLVPLLVATIKELEARITTLEQQ